MDGSGTGRGVGGDPVGYKRCHVCDREVCSACGQGKPEEPGCLVVVVASVMMVWLVKLLIEVW